jgi:hypothetical protein
MEKLTSTLVRAQSSTGSDDVSRGAFGQTVHVILVVWEVRPCHPTPGGIAAHSGRISPVQQDGLLNLNESRALTAGEMQQARADRRARAARFKVGDESEARGSGWLSRFFNAEVRKNALRQVLTPAGPQWVSQDVDFDLLRPLGIGGCHSITKVEIKGTLGNSFPLSRISDRERGFQSGTGAWIQRLILCLWWHKTDRPDCELMHLVPWEEWKQIEADQEAKAPATSKAKHSAPH